MNTLNLTLTLQSLTEACRIQEAARFQVRLIDLTVEIVSANRQNQFLTLEVKTDLEKTKLQSEALALSESGSVLAYG